MSNDERIEAALKRRPADEREYGEPLAALVRRDEGVQRVKPVTRSRVRTGALPALAAIVVVLALGAGALAAGVLRGPAATAGGHNDFQLTGRVDCFGQAPGYIPGPDAASSDGCPLMVVAPTGLETATWVLDPSMPYSAGAAEIHVLAQEWACNSGQDASGRVVQNVQYRDDAVVVTLAIRPAGGMFQSCQSNPATPYVVSLDQAVGNRLLQDGGRWPAATLAKGGQAVVTPSPTPYPSNWHQPTDCSGTIDDAGFFKAASYSAAYDVYCAVLPAGWRLASSTDPQAAVISMTVTYSGPNGAVLELSEGSLCGKDQRACAPAGTSAGTAMFGDREGQLFAGPPGADFALYVAPGESQSWRATGKGMSLDTFKALTAALIIVGK
jgi:hypothetical protein